MKESVGSHLLSDSSLVDFSILKMEAIRSSETSVHTRSTRRHIPGDGILRVAFWLNIKFHKHKYLLRINFKFIYLVFNTWSVQQLQDRGRGLLHKAGHSGKSNTVQYSIRSHYNHKERHFNSNMTTSLRWPGLSENTYVQWRLFQCYLLQL
jgi:hypothetical protein